MNKKTDDLYCNTNYKHILQLLRADTTSKSKAYYRTLHPRAWIPPPCLTSSPQEDWKKEFKTQKYFDIHTSSDEMDRVDHVDRSGKQTRMKGSSSLEGREEITYKLKHLKRDKDFLKETHSKLQYGEGLSSLNDLVHKWRVLDEKTSKNIDLRQLKSVMDSESDRLRPSTKLDSDVDRKSAADVKRTERALQDLERSFRQAKEEEERLKTKLKRLKKEDKRLKENKRPTVKLKKNLNQNEYKILAMKRRYEDLMQYLARLESKNKELKKENEVLHVTLKEENEYPVTERIFTLEQELLNRNKELEKFTEQLNVLNAIQEENVGLKKFVEDLKKREEEHDEERQLKEEDFEREWVKKATDMKVLYERAVQGYKEQLLSSRTSYETLEQKFRSLIQYYEKDEKDLISRYEEEIKLLKSEVNLSKASAAKEQETVGLLKLETLLERKDREISALKEYLKEFEESRKEETSEQFEKKVMEKLSEIINKSAMADENCLESIRETVTKVFEEFAQLQKKNVATIDKDEELVKQNKNLKDELKEKVAELSHLKRDFEKAEKNWETLASKSKENPEKTVIVETKSDLNAEVLREFPRLLKESEIKLKNSETACLKYQLDAKLLQERLRNSTADLETKKSRIVELEDRIKDLMSSNNKLERDNEKLEAKIETLEAQIEKKNRILEKNSLQIEERIREYRSLVSQMEKMREKHTKEMADLKGTYQGHQVEPKLQEAQTFNVRLESQLGALRSEKALEEKMAKKQIRTLEEQITQLKIKNSTSQKHLQSIQDTYKSMFGLEGNNLLPFLTLPNGSSFPGREMEANGRHTK